MSELRIPSSDILPEDALVVHAEEAWFDHLAQGGAAFFEKIAKAATAAGHPAYLVAAESRQAARLRAGPYTHIMMGPKRHRGPRIFHAQPSYIKGFWYLDPQGYFWNASVADAVFDPETINFDDAKAFLTPLLRRLNKRNLSKRDQPPRRDIPPADICFFAQDIEKYKTRVDYLTTEEIIDTLGKAQNRRCLIKLHPLLSKLHRQRIARQVSAYDHLEIVEASVHDLIAASQVVVTQNSATGFEALLYGKRVITCARSDYHHATHVSHSPAELLEALDKPTKMSANSQMRFTYWFLKEQMLQPSAPDFEARALARLFPDQSP